MNFEKIIEVASIEAFLDFGNRYPEAMELPVADPKLQELVELYSPVIKYINALMTKSLKLYHEELISHYVVEER